MPSFECQANEFSLQSINEKPLSKSKKEFYQQSGREIKLKQDISLKAVTVKNQKNWLNLTIKI